MSILSEALKACAAIPKEYRDRGNERICQLKEAAAAFEEFAGQVNQELTQKDAQKREEAIRACRKQLKVIEQIQEEAWPAHVAVVNANNAVSAANTALHAALDSKPKRYPLKEEIAAWESAVQMAREGVAEAEQAALMVSNGPQRVQARLQEARNRMQELEIKEFDLRPKQEQETAMLQGLAPVGVSHGLQGFGRAF
jgi:hypothetical protein